MSETETALALAGQGSGPQDEDAELRKVCTSSNYVAEWAYMVVGS